LYTPLRGKKKTGLPAPPFVRSDMQTAALDRQALKIYPVTIHAKQRFDSQNNDVGMKPEDRPLVVVAVSIFFGYMPSKELGGTAS